MIPPRYHTSSEAIVRPPWPRRSHLLALAAASVFFAAYGSFVPLNFTPLPFSVAAERFGDVLAREVGVQSRTDWVANILLFVPIGFFVVGALCADRPRPWAFLATVPVLVVCAALSVTIEFAQVWFPPRVVSQNDIVAQILGTLAGCLLWGVIGQTLTDWVRSYSGKASQRQQFDWLLQAYVLGFVIYALLPLDVTISIADLYEKAKQGHIVLIPFSRAHGSAFDWVYQFAKDVILLVPIGAWAATVLVGRGRELRPFGPSILIGGSFVVAIELAQIFIRSRTCDATDVITGTAGVALGVVMIQRLRGQPTAAASHDGRSAGVAWLGWLGVAALYAAFLVASYWYPFDFTIDKPMIKSRLSGFFGVPLAALWRGSVFTGISNVLQKLLLSAPLGVLVTVAAYRMSVPDAVRRILLGGLLTICFGIAMGIELGQVLLLSHTPDFTDVLLYTAGVTIGMAVTARRMAADWPRAK